MSYLLHIDSSSMGADSVSRQVAQSFRDSWRGPVVHRDLGAEPVPHLTAAGITSRSMDESARTPDQAAAAAIQEELVGEFLGASAYLFTVPMYNYSIPSVFKAWLDQIMSVGSTMGLPDGPPAAGRPALVISARGGGYGPGAPNHGMDHVIPTLETVLGHRQTLGLDVRVLTPELTFARIMPHMSDLVPLHEASLADSHEQARKLAEAFQAASSI
ncbi:FMN-dependent NADH-azoreductase [Streptomyces sviceus]|uniref:FMN-dependent NADH-azoreductase n=1 Tax=Streptomyces sviceus TaxID=285530 RepID=UPI0036AEE5C2